MYLLETYTVALLHCSVTVDRHFVMSDGFLSHVSTSGLGEGGGHKGLVKWPVFEKNFLARSHTRRKALLLYVHPSVRMYQRGSVWTYFREIWYWVLLWSCVEKVQIWLKSDKNMGHFTWRPTYVWLLPAKYIRHKSVCVQHPVFLYCSRRQYLRDVHRSALLHLHCNNGYGNAPRSYVMRKCLFAYWLMLQWKDVTLWKWTGGPVSAQGWEMMPRHGRSQPETKFWLMY
jgi:hypothetical protein